MAYCKSGIAPLSLTLKFVSELRSYVEGNLCLKVHSND